MIRIPIFDEPGGGAPEQIKQFKLGRILEEPPGFSRSMEINPLFPQ